MVFGCWMLDSTGVKLTRRRRGLAEDFLEGVLLGIVFYGNGVAYRLSTRYATPLMIHPPLRVLRGFAGDFFTDGLVTGLFSRKKTHAEAQRARGGFFWRIFGRSVSVQRLLSIDFIRALAPIC